MDEHHDEGVEAGEAVRVFVRIRPLNKREIAENQTIGWNFNDSSMIEDTQNGQRCWKAVILFACVNLCPFKLNFFRFCCFPTVFSIHLFVSIHCWTRIYAYDHCFGPTGNNQETYDIVGKPVVIKAMEGFNGTVFTCES